MEGTRGDEEDVVGLHHAVARRDGGALHERQQVALHALARDIGSLHFRAARDLVDLIEEHDAVLLRIGKRAALQLVVVHQARRLLLGEDLGRLADPHAPQPAAAATQVGEHALDLRGELLHARRREDLHLRARCGDLDVDLLFVELAFAQPLAEFLARGALLAAALLEADAPGGGYQRVQNPLFRSLLGARAHALHCVLARLLDADLHQVAHDGVDVAPHVSHLRELRRLHLDERSIREPRQAPRDLGLADAGRTDHQDVLRRDFLAQRLCHLQAPPAVAQRDRHGALGSSLPDDVLVQLVDDFLRLH